MFSVCFPLVFHQFSAVFLGFFFVFCFIMVLSIVVCVSSVVIYLSSMCFLLFSVCFPLFSICCLPSSGVFCSIMVVMPCYVTLMLICIVCENMFGENLGAYLILK